MPVNHPPSTHTQPTRPDWRDPHTAAIQSHLHNFFSAMLDAHGTPGPGSFRTISRQPHPFGNVALIAPGAAAASVLETARPLVEENVPSAVILEGGDDDAQGAALLAMGFFRAESMCLMSVTPDALAATSLPKGYRFVEVGPPENARWCDAFAVGYQLPGPLAELFGPGACARRGVQGRYFAAENDGAFAAVSMCALVNGLPGIYAVATRPEHRGRGLGAHLTAEALRRTWTAAHARGVLQSSQMGEPVYRRIGFQSHGHMALYLRIPGAHAGA